MTLPLEIIQQISLQAVSNADYAQMILTCSAMRRYLQSPLRLKQLMIEKFDGDYAFALLYVIQRYDTHDTFKLIFEQLCMDLNGVNCKTLDGTLLRSCLSVEKPVEARLLLLRAIQRANAQCNDDTVSNNLDIEQLSSWAGLCLHTKKAQV